MKEKLIKKTRKVANIIALISLVFNATMFGVFAPEVAKATPVVSDVFFSEYIEGSSNNKALEIFNGTGSVLDLSVGNYAVEMYFNGAGSPGLTINLSGSIKNNDVFVLANTNATDAIILAQADQLDSHGWYNGDDTVILKHNGAIVDVIGQIGYDPGSEWGIGLTSTQDNTLVRNQAVTAGDINGTDTFDPSLEWTGHATNTVSYLGLHKAPSIPTLVSPAKQSFINSNTPVFSWDVSWDSEGDAVIYVMYIEGPNGFYESFVVGPASYPHPGLPYEGDYTWKVKSLDDNGNSSSWSKKWTFTVDTVKPEISGVSVSPNPFSPNGDMQKDVTTVSYTVNEAAENLVRIRDIATDELLWQSPKYDQSAGTHSIDWDGTVDRDVLTYLNGDTVAEGSYDVVVQSTDLAGNIKRDKTQEVEVDITGPAGTYESVVDATNPTNNNDPTVYGKYYGTTAVVDAFATPSDGSIVTDIVSIKVVFEKNYSETEDVSTQGIATRYWKPGYVDGLGQYTTHEEDLYTCEGCPFDSTSVKAQIVPVVTSDVLPDGSYKVYVQSFDNAGNSTIEPIESAQIIDTTAPAVVTNLVVTGKTNTSVSLKWDAVLDAAGYKVYYGTQEGVFTGVKSVGNVTSYTVSGLLANTNYFFKVIAYDSAMNDSLTSNIVTDKTNETQVVLAATSSVGSVSSAGATTPGGAIAGATDEKIDEGTTENEDENKEEDKNKGFNWFWVILLLILAGGGYYYYTINPAFFKRFGKGPTPSSGI